MSGGFGISLIGNLLDPKREIPAWKPITLGDSQTQAIDQNIASLPKLKDLAGDVNSFNQDQMLAMLRKAIPGYDQQVGKVNDIINSELSGEIPKDIQDAIARSGASKALSGGYAGSGMGRNLVARDLGLTSLDLTQKGIDSASKWIQQSAALMMPGQFNVASMFVSPTQQFDATFQNQTAQFQRDWAQENLDYEQSFGHALAQDVTSTMSTIQQLAFSYLGGMGGGGGISSMFGGGKGGNGGFQMDSPNYPNELQG